MNKDKSGRMQQFQIYISNETYNILNKLSAQTSVPKAKYVREAIDDFLKNKGLL